MTRNRWLALVAALTVVPVGLYAAVRSAAQSDAPRAWATTGTHTDPAPAKADTAHPVSAAGPKQYFHFVVDGISYKSGDETGTVKRIEIEYKGDGLVPDLVKTVMPLMSGCEAEKTVDAAELGKLMQAATWNQAVSGSCPATMTSAPTDLLPAPGRAAPDTAPTKDQPVEADGACKKKAKPKDNSKGRS